jgi:hypothetical protein
MAAQNQHYVPKFVLRGFLFDEANERVHVYDKHEDKVFSTAIKNIMAERRFNEFDLNDEYRASFEPVACAAEDQVLPAFREVVEQRRLSGQPEQKAALALMIAFQFLRTKAHRDRWQAVEESLVRMVEAEGGRMQDIQGWEDWQPATENSVKREHLATMQRSLTDFAQMIATKDFVLSEPAPGTSFYIGDNAVALSNSRDFGPYGNLGLALPGIEIYMPLAADLMLSAWCPSLLGSLREDHNAAKMARRSDLLGRIRAGQLSPAYMKAMLEQIAPLEQFNDDLLSLTSEGRPVPSDPRNMQYYNSLQTNWAYRYVISREGNFEFAREVNGSNPELRRGHRLTTNH